jgi:hypothetical protein
MDQPDVIKKHFHDLRSTGYIGLPPSPRISPDRGEQLVRDYGYYSNVSRGKRKKEKPEDKTEISEIDAV